MATTALWVVRFHFGLASSSMIRFLPALIAALLSLVLVLGPTLAQTAGFVESFDGSPAQPADYTNPHNWDFMVLGVDQREPNLAQHGPNCEAPGFPYTASNTHPFSTTNQAVFLCNNHLMTAPGIAGYGAIYMTPPAVADFSQGSARISWDMSTLRTSSRDWVYVTLTPFSEHHEMPYLNTDQHIPPHNIKIALGGVDTFEVFQNGGFQNSRLEGTDLGTSWDDVFAAQTPPVAQSPIRRDTFEMTLSRTTISLCMPNYTWRGVQPFCWARNVALHEPLDPAVWGDQATVQFTHVVYNAEKSCETEALANGYTNDKGRPTSVLDQFDIVHNAYGDLHCPPNTWHWDNVSISPAVPYTVVPSLPSDFSTTSGRAFRVDFPVPSPAGAYLSFVSWGDTPQLAVSFDGGATWQPPHFQEATAFAHPEVGENVFMPIPTGQHSVMVRGAPGYWGGFEAQAFKIVSPPNRSIPTVLPTPTHSPTPAASPISTQTAAPRPTNVFATDTPTPLPQDSATETPTPTSVATPTVGPPTDKPTPEATAVVTGGVCALSITIRDNRLVIEPTPCS